MALKGILVSMAMSWDVTLSPFNCAPLIFEKFGQTILSTNVSSIVLAVLAIDQIVGGFVSTQMGDTFGRRTTLGRE